MTALQSARVLFLPHPMRAAYFDSLLTRARERFGWQIGVLCKFIDRRRYTHLAATPAAIHLIPHWHDPQPWEADAAEVTALEQLVRECEDRSGVALNRMLLAAERDLGAAYNLGSHYFPRHGGVRELLADNKLPARVALRVFRFVRDALDAEKPDLIVAGAATSPVPFATFLLARRRGIPFVMNRHSKVWSDTAFWTDRFDMANALGQARFDARRATNAAVSTEAKAHIAKFRDTPVTVAYIRANWRAAAGRTWWSQHRGFASEAVGGILARMREPGRKGKPLLARMGHFYRSRWLLARQDGMYQTPSDEQLRAMRYVYLPLHKEPELALNFLSPAWHSQKNTIQRLSSFLPSGYRLIVRDHRLNLGRRPTAYLRDVAALPGVMLVHPLDDQFKYLRNASLIVTDNGSSGWEGLLLRRPVLTLAPTFYDGPALAHAVHDANTLADTMFRLLRSPSQQDPADYDTRLGWLLDAEAETSFGVDRAQHDRCLDALRDTLAAQRAAPLRAVGSA